MIMSELLDAQPVLQELVVKKMPVKVAYAIAKNIKLANAELETFEETRIKLLKENWPLDEESQEFKVPDEDKEKWKEMLKELLDTEVSFKPYVVDIALVNGLELTPAQVLNISWMFINTD